MEGYDSYRVKIVTSENRNVTISKGKAVVSSVSKWATKFGIDILKEGGNAFDAAFALAFGLSLFHPQAGNIGGGGYLVYFKKGWESPKVINYREKAPLKIEIDKYFDKDGKVNPEKSSFGPLSVCTPGTVKAFYKLHREYGKLSPEKILKKLSEHAKNGYPLTQYQVECLNRLSPKLALSPESKKIYVKEKGTYKAGDIFKNVHIAKTFELIAEKGEEVFYHGEIAKAIDSDIRKNGGWLSYIDLENYEIKEVTPINCEINGRNIWTVPPEGGGAVLINILNILNSHNFYSLKIDSLEYFHNFIQASKTSFINRQNYMGDLPLDNNKYYLRIFDNSFCKEVADNFGNKDIPTSKLAEILINSNNNVDINEDNNTTHFSIIDKEGNAISNSYTLNLRYGSKWSVKEYGFLLNGSIDAFSFKPGTVNYFGVMGNEANLIAPGKRPASSMAPVIITDRDGIVALLGTPGGPTIPTTLANIIWPLVAEKIVDYGYLVEKGRIHHQAWPDILYLEKGYFPEKMVNSFKELGYKVKFKDEPIGDIHAIFRDKNNYVGISDYRREGLTMSLD